MKPKLLTLIVQFVKDLWFWLGVKLGYTKLVPNEIGLTAAVIKGDRVYGAPIIWGSMTEGFDSKSVPSGLPSDAKSWRFSFKHSREAFCFVRVPDGIRKYVLGFDSDGKTLKLLFEAQRNSRAKV